jgi:radical SAM protein with 4Fe4S-binding SPASM domain
MRAFRIIKNRLYRVMGDIRPMALQIEVTNACNFRCLMCPFHGPEKTSDRAIGFIQPDQYRDIVTQFRNFGGLLVIPQGAGESFLHPEFPDLLKFTRQTLGLSVAFNTNGTHLTPETASDLIDLKIDEIGFSVDALYPETFRAITGGDLQQVEEALMTLVSLKKQRNAEKPFIRVLLVAQQANLNEVDAYIRRWLPVVDEVVIQARRVNAGRMLESPRTEPRKPCRHLFDTVFIQWDGDMVICCEDWESRTSIGNVFHQPLRDLWRSRTMKQYRAMQRAGVYTQPSICRDCQAWAGGRLDVRDHGFAVEHITSLTRVWRRKDTT